MRFSILKSIALIREDPAQRKLLALAAAIIAVFILFWFLVYVPQRAKMVVLKDQLAATRQRYYGLQELVGMGGNIREGIRLVKETHARLENKIPRKGAVSLEWMGEIAAELGVDVVSLKRSDPLVYDQDNAGSGAALKYIPVSLEISGYYREIVECVRQMHQTMPGFLYVDTMRVLTAPSGESRVNVMIDFKLFFLG